MPNYRDSTIVKVRQNESQPIVFSLPSEFVHSTFFESFQVSSSGKVYVVAGDSTDGRQLLFRFDADGSLRGSTRLELPDGVRVRTFALFESSGSALVVGSCGPGAAVQLKGKPFVAIVDNSGRVTRNLKGIQGKNDDSSGSLDPGGGSFMGDDGRLYFRRDGSILAVDESGKVVRRIPLLIPKNSTAGKIVVSEGMVAIWFQTASGDGDLGLTLETTDLNAPRKVKLYSPSEELGNVAVNFTRAGGFVFLKSAGGKMQLLTAPLP